MGIFGEIYGRQSKSIGALNIGTECQQELNSRCTLPRTRHHERRAIITQPYTINICPPLQELLQHCAPTPAPPDLHRNLSPCP